MVKTDTLAKMSNVDIDYSVTYLSRHTELYDAVFLSDNTLFHSVSQG